MSTLKTAKRTPPNESYSHPLIKSLYDAAVEDHSRIVPTYQPIISNNRNRISSKLMRMTTLTPFANSTFTAFLNPLHPTLQEVPHLNRVVECSFCHSIANPHSKIQNYSSLICDLCCATTAIPTYESEEHLQSYAFQYDSQATMCNNAQKRRVCLVIEASQYNFEKKVHNGIINCLSAVKNGDFELGIILFDAKNAYFVDQETLQVTRVTLSKENSEWDCLPLCEEALFRHISHFNEEIAAVIESIMYEAYYIKETALSYVTQLLQKYLSNTCQIKFFITSLNHLGEQSQNIHKNNNILGKIFKEKQNYPQESNKNIKPSNKTQTLSSLSLSQNMQFFLVTQNTSFQQSINVLGYRLVRAYGITENVLQSSIYYNLFQNIESKPIHNLQLVVRTSHCLEVMEPDTPSYNLYGKVKLAITEHHRTFKIYKFIIRQCCQNTMIPIRFKIGSVSACEKSSFQITYRHLTEEGHKEIVLTGSILKVKGESELGLQLMDDECLFNDHLRRAVSQWSGVGFKELKGHIQTEYQQVVRLFKLNYAYDKVNFPKAMKHYFLYVFILLQKINKGLMNAYSIYRMLQSDLETFSKQLYFRTYRLDCEQLRNIKSTKSVLQKYGVVFMQNGEELFMIFCQSAVDDIKHIFGHFDTVSSLANKHYELPELSTNERHRKAIESIRNSNIQTFLRLKIVDVQSSFFECFIAPSLYDKQEHIAFLRKAWKS